jgi:hypothetical protein
MFGSGKGWHKGRFWHNAQVSTPAGYSYIGPCRCGFGPDAFYQDKRGTVVHGSEIYRRGVPPTLTAEDLEAEVTQLKMEKEELERRIKELEEHLKRKGRKP